MRKKLEINLVDVSKSARAEIPEYQTKGASGLDLKASPDWAQRELKLIQVAGS